MIQCPPGPQVFNWGHFEFSGEKFMTTVINPCHRFSVIAGVVDTGEKFITCVNDTSEQLSAVTTKPAINLSPVTTTPVNNYHR
jgi:hypothetical protein